MKYKLIFTLIFLLKGAFLLAEEPTPTLTVSGFATLFKPADQLNILIGVVTESEKAETALDNNSQKMNAVISTLLALKLTPQEYSTGQFSISPIYAPYPKDPPPNWTQKIVGYRVSNTLSIRTDKIDLAGELIDAASESGANSIDHVSFSLKDERMHRQEIIHSATEHALQDAKNLAAAASVKLGRIKQISLDQPRSTEPVLKFSAMAINRETPIEPSDVAISAKVSVIYEIH